MPYSIALKIVCQVDCLKNKGRAETNRKIPVVLFKKVVVAGNHLQAGELPLLVMRLVLVQ